jgi:hypothetical protein
MRIIFSVLVLLASATVQAAVPDSIAAIAGRYVGTAYNGANMDPVVTVLSFDDRGRFNGTYYVADEVQEFEGRLSGLIQEDERAFSLEWTDRFGEGFAYFEFSNDYSSFSGYWTTTDAEQQFPWSGSKQ